MGEIILITTEQDCRAGDAWHAGVQRDEVQVCLREAREVIKLHERVKSSLKPQTAKLEATKLCEGDQVESLDP